jgi:signal transduction histidine kinase
MPNGGQVTVKIAFDPATQMVELTIRDTGCGIEPDKLRRIFDPFFTTKSGPDASGKGGTGLGLSMCRNIIEAHQGRIRVDSTVGRGTAFTLRIPAATAASAAPTPCVSPASTPDSPLLQPG